MINIEENIIKELKNIGDLLVIYIENEYERQGHIRTGSLLSKINYRIRLLKTKYKVEVRGSRVINYLEYGLKPSQIPFDTRKKRLKNSKNKRTSRYIAALIKNFSLRGFSPKNAVSMAFKTAYTQRKEGMPTRGSYDFSSNNRRKFAVRNSLNALNRTKYTEKIASSFIKPIISVLNVS